MSERTYPNVSDNAANAFYGQSEADFAAQIKQLAAYDERLIKAFENTRERFLRGEYARKQ